MLILCHDTSSFSLSYKDSVALPGKEQDLICLPYSKSCANLSRKENKADSNKHSTTVHLQDSVRNYKECEIEQKTRTLTCALWQHQTSRKRRKLAPVHRAEQQICFSLLLEDIHLLVPEPTLASASLKPLLMTHKAPNWRKIQLHVRFFSSNVVAITYFQNQGDHKSPSLIYLEKNNLSQTNKFMSTSLRYFPSSFMS